jgi:hypothetical protein
VNVGGSSSPFDINFDTNASPWKSAAFAWQEIAVGDRYYSISH